MSSKLPSSILSIIQHYFRSSCCCPFLLHDIANLTCIVLVSCQLLLLSFLPQFLHSLYNQKIRILLFFGKKFFSIDVSRFLPFYLRVQISLPHGKNGESQCIIYFYPGKFLDRIWLKVMLKFLSFWVNFVSLSWIFYLIHSKCHKRDIYNSLLVVDICYPQRFYTLLGLFLKLVSYRITFRCDVLVVFHILNTKYTCITSSQNTTKFIALYCTICYTTTRFGPF